MTRKFALLIVMMIAILGLVVVTACTNQTSKPKTSPKKTTKETGGTGVLMLGRSVMAGWFQHGNADTSEPFNHEGFTLYYRELESPPEIAQSAEKKVDEYEAKVKIVFFKLCFVDFEGGSREEAEHNLLRNKAYVAKVYESAVKKYGKKLVIGNALPQVKKSASPDLVWNHQQYNSWLNDFSKQHPGEVYVFDQYSILADSEGNLKAEYASSSDDSHPNDTGYSALDGPFLSYLRL